MRAADGVQAFFDFIALEARLLDAGRFDDWLALFADECRYWIPLRGAAQTEGDAHNAIADEDRLLLSLRVQRLKSPRAHSLQPPVHCQHVLQQPTVIHADEAGSRFELATPFLYIEARGEDQLLLAGTALHLLVRDEASALRIALKRIDLVNAGAPLPAIQLFP